MAEVLTKFEGVRNNETGEIFSYNEKNIIPKGFRHENINWVEENRNKSDFNVLIETNFGSYYLYFYNKLGRLDIPNQFKLRFLFLCSYINWNTENHILINTDKETHQYLLSKDDLFSLLKLGTTEFKKTMAILKNNDLLKDDKDKYYINNDYVVKGELSKSQAKDEYTRIFTESMKNLYENCNPRLHKQLYYLFALLPYVNHKFNVICEDTTVTIESLVEALNMTDICRKVGYNPKNTKRLWNELKEIKINNKYAIKKVVGGDGEFIKINPCVYYGGTSSQLESLKGLMLDFDYKVH